MILGIFLPFFLSFVQPNRIEYLRRSFLQFFSRFQHFSNSISLSLFQLSFTNPARDRYIPVRLTFHSFGRLRRSKNILFNRERNFDTCSSLRLFPSSELEGGSFVFQRDVLRVTRLYFASKLDEENEQLRTVGSMVRKRVARA